ncbi:MAG TPA: hypothetical protein VM802_23940 [Chitinophaga sp.]|uniref:hypothetical protein n=1 Tax=Chitinophaga sp. TaxID=1869181 RepID=UPI002C09ACBB|nr:hypothetical protein [Chitinophaga sp.]HVI47940.1 hypothetical protein [Chitinophaga sp.]
MKLYRLIVLVCGIGMSTALQAQVPIVTLSPSFEEPGDGWDKLIQLKNGNTVHMHFAKKGGIQVAVYNPGRELIATDSVAGRQWNAADMETTEIDGIFEIKGQPVIFLQQQVKDTPVFYRLILDPKTGGLLREDKLGELTTVRHRSVYARENLASHDCYVEKDQRSDHYAVALFSGAEIQPQDSIRQRIKIMHFSPEHELINTGWYYLQDTSYCYFSYISMTVDGPDKVYMGTVGFNAKRTGTAPQSKVIFSMLSRDSASFAHHLPDYTADFGDVSGQIRIMPSGKEVGMWLNVPAAKVAGGSGIYYNLFLTSSGKLRKHTQLSFPELSRNTQMFLEYKEDYKGAPQRIILNEDGTATLLLESLTRFKQGNTQVNRLHTNLGDLGITTLDTAGRESTTIALSKYQVITGISEPFLLERRNKSEWVFRNKIAAINTNTYLSYDYITIPQASFVLFNDYLQYLDTGGQDKTRKPLKYASDANFVCYRFYSNKMERLFLFGNPEVSKGYYCMMGASDYNAQKRVYATVMITRKGTDKQEKKACIAWIQF